MRVASGLSRRTAGETKRVISHPDPVKAARMNEQLLVEVPLFAALPAEACSTLAAALARRTLQAQEILLREGEQGESCYFVLDGLVEVVKALDTPDEHSLSVRGVGEVIGEMALLEPGVPRAASVRALTPVGVLELKRDDFEALLCRYPAFACTLVRTLSARLRESDNATIGELREKNRQLTAAYHDLQAAQAQLIEKEALERELQVARDIQEHMLPRMLPAPPGFEVAARMVPARMVSGDFFDCIPLGSESVGVVVGDVCGKGVPAALYMALSRSLLRAEAGRGGSARGALRRVNQLLRDLNDTGMFVTLLYGVLDSRSQTFSYIRAGHLPPLLMVAGGAVELPIGVGQPLGLLADPLFDEGVIALPAGSTLVLYTDGVTEATNPHDQFFGLAGLQDVVGARHGLPAQQLCDAVIAAVAAYRGTAPQADDITLVAVRARSGCGHADEPLAHPSR
jgi:sigma-B regulation protein RsbU (phosphoserine phosphatase)